MKLVIHCSAVKSAKLQFSDDKVGTWWEILHLWSNERPIWSFFGFDEICMCSRYYNLHPFSIWGGVVGHGNWKNFCKSYLYQQIKIWVIEVALSYPWWDCDAFGESYLLWLVWVLSCWLLFVYYKFGWSGVRWFYTFCICPFVVANWPSSPAGGGRESWEHFSMSCSYGSKCLVRLLGVVRRSS